MVDGVTHGVVRGHVAEAVHLLRSRLTEPWTFSSLAEEMHLSRAQLARCFDTVLGVGPITYLKQLRVQEICRQNGRFRVG